MIEKFFEDRFYVDDRIVQDYSRPDLCNPEVDSMYLTSNVNYLTDNFFNPFSFIDPDSGLPRRWNKASLNGHPYNSPDNVSRDNLMGFMVYLSSIGLSSWNRRWAKKILSRGSFFFNSKTTKGEKKFLSDFCGPEHWATIIRTLSPSKYLYPLVYILDIFFAIRIAIHVIRYTDKASTVLHTLSACKLHATVMPTLISDYAILLFLIKRKVVKGYEMGEDISCGGIYSALKYYSRAPYDPPLHNLGTIFIDNIIKPIEERRVK